MSDPTYAHDRVPPVARLGILAAIVAGAAGVLIVLEIGLRALGIPPSHYDVADMWIAARLDADRSPGIVVVGSSRTQIAVDPSRLAVATGRPVHQLSINGGSPFPVLHHACTSGLAADRIVVEFTPRRFGTADGRARDKANRWIDAFEQRARVAGTERRARRWLRDRLVFLSASAGLPRLVGAAVGGRLPSPPDLWMDGDRRIYMDYGPEQRRRARARGARVLHSTPRMKPDALRARLTSVNGDVRCLAARGTRVTFVRPPSCGDVRAAEAERLPRRDLYEAYRTAVGGADWVHFEEAPESFECADGSHLTPASAEAFTAWLADRLGEAT
jgi:hypothetical protein